MNWSARRIPGFLAIVAIGIGAACYSMVYLISWHHERSKTHRIDAYRELIWRHAQSSSVPTELVRAIIEAESSGNRTAVSSKKAKGLMQITPIAEREVLRQAGLAKGDLFDPDYNIRIGTTYLRMLIDRFEGDVYLAVAAYHMGPARARKLRDASPNLSGKQLVEKYAPSSTSSYCRTILVGRSVRLEGLGSPAHTD